MSKKRIMSNKMKHDFTQSKKAVPRTKKPSIKSYLPFLGTLSPSLSHVPLSLSDRPPRLPSPRNHPIAAPSLTSPSFQSLHRLATAKTKSLKRETAPIPDPRGDSTRATDTLSLVDQPPRAPYSVFPSLLPLAACSLSNALAIIHPPRPRRTVGDLYCPEGR